MKKITKTLISAAIAGTLCLSASALVACNKNDGDGKSAYDIAVDNGFEGTEQEWLDSLKTQVKDTDVSYSTGADGKTVATVTITMTDDSQVQKQVTLPHRVVSASLNNNRAIWSVTQATEKSNLTGITWRVIYDDGSEGILPAGKSQIVEIQPYTSHYDQNAPAWDGTFIEGNVYDVEYCFSANWYSTTGTVVYICNNVSSLTEQIDDDPNLECQVRNIQKGDTFDINTLYISQRYDLESKLNETYSGQYYGSGTFYNYTAVTESMLDSAIDTSTVGYKRITVTYNQEKYRSSFEVYDPSVTVVESLYFREDLPYRLSLTVGDNIATVAEQYVDQVASVSYYVYVNGRDYETITTTAAMIDTSGVDTATPGRYTLKINYKGYSKEIDVTVNPNMSAATKTQTLTGTAHTVMDMMTGFRMSVDKIELYNNGYAVAFSGAMELTEMSGYIPYTLADGVLEIKYGSEKLGIFKVTGGTFAPYEFTSSQLEKTYTGSVPMSETTTAPITLRTYNNGYAELDIAMGGPEATTFVLGYTIEGDTITIAPEGYITFTVGENNTITMNMDY